MQLCVHENTIRQWSPTFVAWWPIGGRGEPGWTSVGLAHMHVHAAPLNQERREAFGVRFCTLSGFSTAKGTEGLKQQEITFVHLQKLLAPKREAFGVRCHVPSDSPRLPNAPKVDRVSCASSLGESVKMSRAHSSHSASALTTPFLEHWEQVAWWPSWEREEKRVAWATDRHACVHSSTDTR